MASAINDTKRSSPFILQIGSTYHIVADSEHFLTVSGNSLEAFISLISMYYVLHLSWCAKVENTLLFVQSELLGIQDCTTKKSKALVLSTI